MLYEVITIKQSFGDRRSDGALIRLITPVTEAGDLTAADARLSGFLSERNNFV